MVGVRHLADTVKQFDPARDDAPLALWQQPLQEITAGVKKHKLKTRFTIGHGHAVWPVLAGRDMMRTDGHGDGHRAGRHDVADAGANLPVNAALRQGKQHVAGPGDGHMFQ